MLQTSQKSKLTILWELFATFFKIGLFTFGGGYAMISIIERETVDKKGWVTQEDIMNMVIIAESTPGVIAVNSATFVGYKVGGIWGGIIATLGVVLPSFMIILLISLFWGSVKDNKYVAAAFRGIRCAVAVLIFNALKKLGKQVELKWYNVLAIAVVFAISVFTSFDVIYLIIIGGVVGIIVSLATKNAVLEAQSDGNELPKTKIASISHENDENCDENYTEEGGNK